MSTKPRGTHKDHKISQDRWQPISPKTEEREENRKKRPEHSRSRTCCSIDFFSFLRRIGDDSNGGAVNCGDFTWKASVSLMNKSKSNPTVWGCSFWSFVNITFLLFLRAMGNAVFCLHFPVFFSMNRTCGFSLNRYIVFGFWGYIQEEELEFTHNFLNLWYIVHTHWYTYPFFPFWDQIVTKSVFLSLIINY